MLLGDIGIIRERRGGLRIHSGASWWSSGSFGFIPALHRFIRVCRIQRCGASGSFRFDVFIVAHPGRDRVDSAS